MPLSFVATVGGVGLEDVAVATLQFFVECGSVDCTGTDVVGKGCGQYRIFPEMGVHGAKFSEIFSQ